MKVAAHHAPLFDAGSLDVLNRLRVRVLMSPASTANLMSYGSSAIVEPRGTVVQSARVLCEGLIAATIDLPAWNQFPTPEPSLLPPES